MSLEASVRTRRGDFELDVELTVAWSRIVSLVGPNGSGKTTLLHALAGLLPVDRGRIELDGVSLESTEEGVRVAPSQRGVGMVFQDRLLFPHLTVRDNVGFGLRARGWTGRAARARAAGLLEEAGLAELANRRPGALSGGQAQRVALARALAVEPRLLLLDEPLGALDVSARPAARRALLQQLSSFAGVRLLVTHDPIEAALLGDRLIVMEQGRIVQEGTPDELRARPRSSYVAGFVGLNLLRGTVEADRIRLSGGGELVVAGAGRGEVLAAVHPHAVSLFRARPEGSPRNLWRCSVGAIDFEDQRVRVRLEGPAPIVAEVTRAAASELRLADGGEVWAAIKATEVSVYPT